MEYPKGKSGNASYYHGAYAVASGFAAFVPYHHEEEPEDEVARKADSEPVAGLSAPSADWREAG